jgi:alkanesulfonate monooxygenase SsuD/methylene tetrahydromethanopterin reductase-like flavin-dependent oxidoreductase (luciferase family)
VRWGLSLSLAGDLAQPAVVAEIARAAEHAGWDGVFVWDHLWNRTKAPFADPFVTLAAIAAATEGARIGTLVVAMSRRRPQLVAQAVTTLDRLSGGRVVLGIGAGVDGHGEYTAFGEGAADDRARAEALDAGIELLLPMLAGGPVPAVDGRVTTEAGVQRPRVPVWVAGRAGRGAGPRRLRRHGLDGVALVGTDTWSPELATAALSAAEAQPGSIDVALVGGAHPDPDRLVAAGATWCIPEIPPGASAADAFAVARRQPA